MLIPQADSFALFDNNLDDDKGKNPLNILLTEPNGSIELRQPEDVGAFFRQLELAAEQKQWIALAANYELGYALEPRFTNQLKPGEPLATAWLFKKQRLLSTTETEDWLAEYELGLAVDERISGLAAMQHSMDKTEYDRLFAEISQLISAGDCYQINLTFMLHARLYGHPLSLYRLLRGTQKVRYGGLLLSPEQAILSRSPELFFSKTAREIECRPMKGTADIKAQADDLVQSAKDRAENLMIVDLIRNDLARLVGQGGQVEVSELFRIEAYETVRQMVSIIKARPCPPSLLAIFTALFPCGSVVGAPKIRAMEIIAKLEAQRRQHYCGAFGWVSPMLDCQFNVPIRSLIINADRQIRQGIGSGIVADSEVDKEWQECLLKHRFVDQLPKAFELLETMAVKFKAGIPVINYFSSHLERLQKSATYFNFQINPAEIHDQILHFCTRLPTTPASHLLRLRCNSQGNITLKAEPLNPANEPLKLMISQHRLDSQNLFNGHKTSLRNIYQQAFTDAQNAACFDGLLLNERDELVETSRCNLFLATDNGLATPPLTSGSLPGVLRQHLLEQELAFEQTLYLPDLFAVRQIFIGNSARGLLPVTLSSSFPEQNQPSQYSQGK